MTSYRCVKCGASCTTDDAAYRRNRDCAPACDDCREAVTKETRKRYGMWPSDYRGGWLWDHGQWHIVVVHEKDKTE